MNTRYLCAHWKKISRQFEPYTRLHNLQKMCAIADENPKIVTKITNWLGFFYNSKKYKDISYWGITHTLVYFTFS